METGMAAMLLSLCGIALVLIILNLKNYVKEVNNTLNKGGSKKKDFIKRSTKISEVKVQDKSKPASFKKKKRKPKLKKNEQGLVGRSPKSSRKRNG